jgi:L-alanine-DL-glutamate epimerase-like enolase superfamily enzyme
MSRIASLETFHDEFVCFVRVTAEDGAIGWGQTAPYNADITAQVCTARSRPGRWAARLHDIAGLVDLIERREHKYPGSYRCRAMAGLDTALWDMAGRRAGKPVATLLGGAPRPIRAYASSMRRDIAPEAEAERLARAVRRGGLHRRQVAHRRGMRAGRGRMAGPDGGDRAAPSVARWAMGIDKLVDANSGFSVARAIAVGRMLEDHGVAHYEEPVPWWDLDATAEVTAALDIDVTGGEQDWDLATWRAHDRPAAVDVVQPDIMYMGGLTRTLEVAAGWRTRRACPARRTAPISRL